MRALFLCLVLAACGLTAPKEHLWAKEPKASAQLLAQAIDNARGPCGESDRVPETFFADGREYTRCIDPADALAPALGNAADHGADSRTR